MSSPPAETRSNAALLAGGVRAGIPFAIAGGILAASFGVVAQDAGLTALDAIVMSAIMFAGSAQFAAIAIIGGGGTVGAALGAAALMNSRFLPMGAALAPSLPGGPLKRAAQGQAVVDASWAVAARGDGSFDRWMLIGASLIQYATWVLGTIVGAFGADLIGDPRALGLDAIFPAFFLGLLITEMHGRRALAVGLAGAAISLAVVPFTPVGVPVLTASLAALAGLTSSAKESAREAAARERKDRES